MQRDQWSQLTWWKEKIGSCLLADATPLFDRRIQRLAIKRNWDLEERNGLRLQQIDIWLPYLTLSQLLLKNGVGSTIPLC